MKRALLRDCDMECRWLEMCVISKNLPGGGGAFLDGQSTDNKLAHRRPQYGGRWPSNQPDSDRGVTSHHHWSHNILLMLGQRRKRWPNINTILGESLEFAGVGRVFFIKASHAMLLVAWTKHHRGKVSTITLYGYLIVRARILVQVTIYRRLRIGRDRLRYIVTCWRILALILAGRGMGDPRTIFTNCSL